MVCSIGVVPVLRGGGGVAVLWAVVARKLSLTLTTFVFGLAGAAMLSLAAAYCLQSKKRARYLASLDSPAAGNAVDIVCCTFVGEGISDDNGRCYKIEFLALFIV